MSARQSSPPLAVFWAHVDVAGPYCEQLRSKCWLWTGGTNGAAGYGQMHVGQEHGGWRMLAHRFSYENTYGPIPPGLTIDHLCFNPRCVAPHHLEAVSLRTNILRGNGFAAIHARKTCCPQGHEYTPDNTRISVKGSRICRACERQKARERYYARKGRAA